MFQRKISHLHDQSEKGFGYAQAVRIGDRIFISGTTALDEKLEVQCPGDLPGQLQIVYGNLKATLAQFGLGFGHVVKEQIFTTDMSALVAANDQRKSFFSASHLPATTAVEVNGLVMPDLMIEVELEANAMVDVAVPQTELGR